MARADNSYSRLVSWLKILLPLAALAILSTLFLVADKLDPEQAIPYAERDAIDELVEEQRISAPAFATVGADGTAVSVAAETARPDPAVANRLIGQALQASFLFPGGNRVDIESPAGILDGTAREATLSGGTSLVSSDGFQVETDTMRAAFDGAFAESAGEVRAKGPVGDLTAGRLVLSQDDEGAYLLRFTDGVRLIYDPQS